MRCEREEEAGQAIVPLCSRLVPRSLPPYTVFGNDFETATSTSREGRGWLSAGHIRRYRPQIVVSVVVVVVLSGGAYYSSRASEATPRVVYSTSLEEVVAEAQAPLLVNVNTAEPEDLEELPEVGPSTAQSIVEYREANGAFRSLDDLASVREY